MSGGLADLHRRYGAGPLHLAILLVCFIVAAYALTRVILAGILVGFVLWFIGAVILHDLVAFPLYSRADAALQRRRWPVNHLRVPAGLSALLLVVWFPLVLRAAEHNYREATGLSTAPFFGRWLLVTLALFAGSALLYVLRRATGARRTGRKR
ncbi:lipoprotein [Microtetraspora sp. NBRC 13810]|uniref:hypothetical protein n=1 Tax=Microtetraspora sp. NBRC 13810 TaxID=3030990 RepID=UPI0024A06858|nr:hypothetical protein [Microtetraspora sp. NBRC 13810]GLW11639.1 lipoprotein [Microtetraspora sp. NBRC 13810]